MNNEDLPVYDKDRNPLHPRALRTQDLRHGRVVVLIDKQRRSMQRARIETTTTVEDGITWIGLDLGGYRDIVPLSDIGAERYGDGIGWHPLHVVLDPVECDEGFPQLSNWNNAVWYEFNTDVGESLESEIRGIGLSDEGGTILAQ